MSKVTRSPSNELTPWFNRGFDDIFEGFFKPLRSIGSNELTQNFPSLDVVEHNDKYIVTAELPGMDSKDIDVTYDNGLLTISGEKRDESTKEDKEGRVIHRECSYGKYVRQFRLNTDVKESEIKAQYKNGILNLTIPKTQESQPKKVKIDIH